MNTNPLQREIEAARQFERSMKSQVSSDASRFESTVNDAQCANSDLTLAKRAISFLNEIRQIKSSKLPNDIVVEPEAEYLIAPSQRQIGRFRIVGTLGAGGFAKVFKALDPELDRIVALKVPLPEALASEDATRRFAREARAAATLSHPAIVPVFESGSAGPVSYISYEYCEGPNLAEWFADNNRQVSFETAARLVREMANAVQHAHQKGVIHRDLKPANILVISTDTKDISQAIRIADFGLARYVADEELSLTKAGDVIGTPAYMSPEQATGSQATTHSSDIYSLGVILYELATGTLPIQRSNQIATLNAIVNDAPVDPRQYKPSIPKDLSAIILKCLNKKPAERYATCHDLAVDLDNFLHGRAIRARHWTWFERTKGWAQRNPAVSAATCIAFTSLVCGLFFSIWHLREARLQATRAQRHLSRLDDTIDRILGKVSNAVEDMPQLTSLNRELHQTVAQIQQELIEEESNDPNVQLSALQAYLKISEIHYAIGNIKASTEFSEQARNLIDRMMNNGDERPILNQLLIQQFLQEARLNFTNNQYQPCRDSIEHAIVLLNRLSDEPLSKWTRLRYATAYRIQASIERETNQLELAKQSLGKALEYIGNDEVQGSDDEAIVIAMIDSANQLADLHVKMNEQQDAEKILLSAADTLVNFVGNAPDDASMLFRLAKVRAQLARLQIKQNHVDSSLKTNRLAHQDVIRLIELDPDNQRYRMLLVSVLQQLASCYDRYHDQERTRKFAYAAINENRKLGNGLPQKESLMKRLQWYVDFLARRQLFDSDFLELCAETNALADEFLAKHPDEFRSLRTKTEVHFALSTHAFLQNDFASCVDHTLASQTFNHRQMAINPNYVYGKFFEARKILPRLAMAKLGSGNLKEAISIADRIYDTCPYRIEIPLRAASVYAAIWDSDSNSDDKSLSSEQRSHVHRQLLSNLTRMFEVGYSNLSVLYRESNWSRLLSTQPDVQELIEKYAQRDPQDFLELHPSEIANRWDPLDYPNGRTAAEMAVAQASLKGQWLASQGRVADGVDNIIQLSDIVADSHSASYQTAKALAQLIKFVQQEPSIDATSETLAKARRAAIQELQSAIEQGFSSVEKLRRSSWDAIRHSPEFQAIETSLLQQR